MTDSIELRWVNAQSGPMARAPQGGWYCISADPAGDYIAVLASGPDDAETEILTTEATFEEAKAACQRHAAAAEYQGRIQSGLIINSEDFFQLVMDVAYMIDGDLAGERGRIRWLSGCLERYLDAHPDVRPHPDGKPNPLKYPFEHFAMYSVARLVEALVRNHDAA